ncbi:IS256 family transposase [Mycoplasma seminis]|uniref:Mutator family transposase n=1 Tax=Mycoplasma seminis TaxID=512749 RepID=A0ABY9HAW7_9MOLU|nr:transposase [Mycoplasma seminis]WLP85745.1 transposase [Mycoplasma seminis]
MILKIKMLCQKSYKVAVYTAIGITEDNYKELLLLEVKGQESKKNWEDFLQNLIDRGLSDPDVIVSDEFSGNEILNELFPTSKLQKCAIHKLRNAVKTVPQKQRKEFCADFKAVVISNTREEADLNFSKLKQKYNSRFPKAIRIIENSLDDILRFLELPKELRIHIWTNNISEGFNSALKRYIKEKRSHASVRTLEVFVILASFRITKNWATSVFIKTRN